MRLTHLDLFSGIGGFAAAARWCGVETVGFCEIDPWPRRVLAKNFPGVPIHDDIKTLTAATLRDWGIRTNGDHGVALSNAAGDGRAGRRILQPQREREAMARTEQYRGNGDGGSVAIDLITGGYPCQPFSVAGQRLGAEDDRHLWPDMRRVIDLTRPRFILAENVTGHVTMGLDTVLAELEADGYACGAVVIPACAVNALHRRDRVWIMAHAEARGLRRGGAPRKAGQPALSSQGMADAESNAGTPPRSSCCQAGAGSPLGDSGEPAGTDAGKTPRALDTGTPRISAGLVRRPAAGPAEPDLIRAAWADGSWEHDLPRVVADEPERRQKLQGAGNAIVAFVAYEILRVMLEQEDH